MDNYEDNDGSFFTKYNVYSIYLPLTLYLISIILMIGFLKGLLAYFITCPVILAIMFFNCYYEDNNTLNNFFKISFWDGIGIIICLSLLVLIA